MTSHDTTSTSETPLRDIAIDGDGRNWYIDVPQPPRQYRVDIGYISRRGDFFVLARSNVVTPPKAGSAEALDAGWEKDPKKAERILAMSTGFESTSHPELKALYEERLRRPLGAPKETGFGTGATLPGSLKKFFFEIDAKLIVFGRTDPTAHLTLGNDPVDLKPDGTFVMSFSLPDSRQIIPAVAHVGRRRRGADHRPRGRAEHQVPRPDDPRPDERSRDQQRTARRQAGRVDPQFGRLLLAVRRMPPMLDLLFPLADEPDAPPGEFTLVRVSRRAMATTFEIAIPAGTHSDAIAAATAALDLIDELEDQMTVYRDHSEVSRLNATAADAPVVVERELFDLFTRCAAWTRETEGAFDIATGALVKAWGFFRREGRVPAPTDRNEAMARSGIRHVILNPELAIGEVPPRGAGTEPRRGRQRVRTRPRRASSSAKSGACAPRYCTAAGAACTHSALRRATRAAGRCG